MSNHLAIATVTMTIRYILARALENTPDPKVGNASITTLSLDKLARTGLAAKPGLNVLLYQVTPNHAGSPAAAHTRASSGALTARPSVALDLHYLLTGYGDADSLEGQRLLARGMLALATLPELTRDTIARAVDAYGKQVETAFLGASDLAQQAELVKLSPIPLSIEDLTRLWGAYPQAVPELSVAYRATAVVLEADVATRTNLPVQHAQIRVQATARSTLASVRPETPGAVITAGTKIVLRGTSLIQAQAPITRIAIGDEELLPEPGGTPVELTVTLTDAVPSGIHSVRVAHVGKGIGKEPDRVRGSSNAVPLLVHPGVSVATEGNTHTLTVRPAIRPRQRVTVLLDRVGTSGPATWAVRLPTLTADASPTTSVVLDSADLPEGVWIVRIDVDGVCSVPEFSDSGYTGPELKVVR